MRQLHPWPLLQPLVRRRISGATHPPPPLSPLTYAATGSNLTFRTARVLLAAQPAERLRGTTHAPTPATGTALLAESCTQLATHTPNSQSRTVCYTTWPVTFKPRGLQIDRQSVRLQLILLSGLIVKLLRGSPPPSKCFFCAPAMYPCLCTFAAEAVDEWFAVMSWCGLAHYP